MVVRRRSSRGGCLSRVHLPDLMFWVDASDQGLGVTVADHFQSGLRSVEEVLLSINVRELLAVERGLLAFRQVIQGRSAAVFSDNTTALCYLRH